MCKYDRKVHHPSRGDALIERKRIERKQGHKYEILMCRACDQWVVGRTQLRPDNPSKAKCPWWDVWHFADKSAARLYADKVGERLAHRYRVRSCQCGHWYIKKVNNQRGA